MKIKFESDDNFLLGKTFHISDLKIVSAFVLENGKYYPQTFFI